MRLPRMSVPHEQSDCLYSVPATHGLRPTPDAWSTNSVK